MMQSTKLATKLATKIKPPGKSGDIEQIMRLQRRGCLRPLDVQLAGLADRIAGGAESPLLLAVALASRAVEDGHACIDLAACAGRRWRDLGGAEVADEAPLPTWELWREHLQGAAARRVVGGGEDRGTLLVLDGSRLYLRRYWRYERIVEERIQALAAPRAPQDCEPLLEKYFPDDARHPEAVAQQRQAARNAVSRGLAILSGGPGTGKTYALARIVAMLAELHQRDGGALAVRIAAPTGKASQRVVESLQGALASLRGAGIPEALLDAIPQEASTIHRLLGTRYDSPYFRHDRGNPLAADLVVVDEASMVDLPLMAKLLDALKPECRLLLVGDGNQLASVEPGRVYGDICRAAAADGPLAGCLTTLTESRRFPAESPIGRVSAAIHADAASAWGVLLAEVGVGTALEVHPSGEALAETGDFADWVEANLRSYLEATEPAAALTLAGRFRILCALRGGPYGVEAMNVRVERILARCGLNPAGRFYDHRLILVTVNTPALGLFNGDVGVVLAERDAAGARTGKLLGWFTGRDGAPRSVPVNLLPEHETAFAMTVHKSQGSEFPHLALVLPEEGESPVLTRELLYTGLTRVKIEDGVGGLRLYCTEAGFRAAVARRTERASGLLHGESVRNL
jgi:exodeoxyribonuclease V alpha subunit